MDEKEFLNHIDNGVLFEDDELQEMPWLFKVVDTIEDSEVYKRRRGVSTIFKIQDRLFRLDWIEDLGEYQEHEFYEQPYEVEKVEKTIVVKEYVKKGEKK